MENKPRLLIVEDEVPTLERLVRIMGRPPLKWIQNMTIPGFAVDTATTVKEAREYLKNSQEGERYLEAILLDLSLPSDHQGGGTYVQNGLDLLAEIRAKYVPSVVVLTGHPDLPNVIECLRTGAADFVPKPITTRDDERALFMRLVNAVRKTGEALYRKMETQRIHWLDDNARRTRERLSRLVTEGMGQISSGIDQTTQLLSRRYGLDLHRDADDPMCKELAGIAKRANELVQTIWQQDAEEEEQGRYLKVDVSAVIADVSRRIRPCYFYREVDLREKLVPGLTTRTFSDDLRLMLMELILDALKASPEGSTVELSCKPDEDEKDIVVSILRRGKAVPEKVKESFRKGEPAPGDPKSEWYSLYFVRRIANNMGAGFVVEPHGKRTSITVRIPVVDDE